MSTVGLKYTCSALICLFTPTALHAQDNDQVSQRLSGQISVVGVAGKRAVRDDEDADSSGVGVSAEIASEWDLGKSALRLDASSFAFAYADEERGTRWSKSIASSYEVATSQASRFGFRARYSDKLVTVEASETDEVELRGYAELTPGRHRVLVYGGWRWREYDRTQSTGNGPIAGARYRYRLGRSESLLGDLRLEDVTSSDTRYGFHRVTGEVRYTVPIKRRTQMQLGATARRFKFKDRLIPSGDEQRRDWTISPRLSLLHRFSDRWFTQARAEWIFRDSNHPRFTGDGPRLRVEAGYRF